MGRRSACNRGRNLRRRGAGGDLLLQGDRAAAVAVRVRAHRWARLQMAGPAVPGPRPSALSAPADALPGAADTILLFTKDALHVLTSAKKGARPAGPAPALGQARWAARARPREARLRACAAGAFGSGGSASATNCGQPARSCHSARLRARARPGPCQQRHWGATGTGAVRAVAADAGPGPAHLGASSEAASPARARRAQRRCCRRWRSRAGSAAAWS